MNKIKKLLFYFIILYFTVVFFITDKIFIDKTIFSIVKEALIALLFIITLDIKSINKSKKFFIAITIYIILIVFNLFRTNSMNAYLIDLKYYFIWPLIIPISKKIFKSELEIKKILRYFQLIAVIIGIIGYYLLYIGDVEYLHSRFTYDFAIMSILSTHLDFGMLMYVGVLSTIISIVTFEEKNIKNYILLIIYNFLGYYSFSRTAYIAIFILQILFVIRYLYKNILKDHRLIVSVSFFILSLLICIIPFTIKFIEDLRVFSIESLIMRIEDTWKNIFASNMLIGDGFGIVGNINRISSFEHVAADNMYNRIIINIGVVGLSVIIIMIGMYLKKYKLNGYSLFIILSLAIPSIFADIFTLTPSMIMIYSIIGISMNIKNYNTYKWKDISYE